MSFAGDKWFGLFHTCFMWRIPSKAPRREWEETIVVYSFVVFMSVCSECCCCCRFMLDGYSQIDASDTSQIHRNCHSKMWWQCGMKRGGCKRWSEMGSSGYCCCWCCVTAMTSRVALQRNEIATTKTMTTILFGKAPIHEAPIHEGGREGRGDTGGIS